MPGQQRCPLPLSEAVARTAPAWDALCNGASKQPDNMKARPEAGRAPERRRGRREPQGRRWLARRLGGRASRRSTSSAELEILRRPGLEAARPKRRLARAPRSGEIDAVVVGGGDGSIRTVAGVLAQHRRSSRHPAARHAQSLCQGPRHPACTSGGRRSHRQGRDTHRRSRRGQWRDLHQQLLDRHLPLYRSRPRAAKGPSQARQMDGDGAGAVPRAEAFSAPPARALGGRLDAALPHAVPSHRQ